MSEYTPTIEVLRADYVRDRTRNFDAYTVGRSLTSEQEVYGAAFDRALAAHDAEVAAQAWDEGYGTGWVDGEQAAHGGEVLEPVNPYREGREQ